jgi:hypothetical protein
MRLLSGKATMLVNSTNSCLSTWTKTKSIFLTILVLLHGRTNAIPFSWDSPTLRYLLKRENLKAPTSIQHNSPTSFSDIDYKESKISFLSWTIEPTESYPTKPISVSFKRYFFSALQGSTKSLAEEFSSNSTHFYFSPSFLFAEESIGTSLLTRFRSSHQSSFTGRFAAPFLNTKLSNLITDFKNLRVINVDTHHYLSMKQWSENLRLIFEQTRSQHNLIVLTGDFSINDKEREEYLFELAKKHNLQRVTFKNDSRCRHNGFAHNYIFTKGFKLRSAEVFPIEGFEHNPLEVVLEPVIN